MNARSVYVTAVMVLGAGLACGSEGPLPLGAERGGDGDLNGSLQGEDRMLQFWSRRPSASVAEVELEVGELSFEARYDYAAQQVVTDGHGQALDRPAHQLLHQAIEAVAGAAGGEAPSLTFQEQALYATLVTWQQSGGIPLDRRAYSLALAGPPDAAPAPGQPPLASKSLEDDGIRCVEKGTSYLASFDFGETVIIDRVVTAGDLSCDGLCGPDCVELTPFEMWTFDCLEHDACCGLSDAPDCWVPLGQCGDEYEHAIADFLRGFSPLRSHCGG